MDKFDATFHQVIPVIAHRMVPVGIDIHLERFIVLYQTRDHFVRILDMHIVVGRAMRDQ